MDINWELMNLTFNKYKLDDGIQQDITEDLIYTKKHNLVFTYQVLQHINPDNIRKALNNLLSLTNKELWMWEGIGKHDGYKHLDKTHNAHNGSWIYHINKMVECYEVSIPKTNKIELTRQRLYKVKI